MRNARPTKVGEGAAYLAHEMNQPLAAILLNAEAALRWLMRDPPDFEAARQSIDRVVGNGRRAAQVAGRVRNMARKSAQARAGVNINEVVRTCLDLAGADLERHDISVETDLDDGLAPVEADRLQLEQLVTNLIANAVDAMQVVERRRHRLRIRTYRDTTGTVEVAIEDTGTGLDPTGIDHIFVPYHTPSATAWGWDCRFVAPSSKDMADGCRPRPMSHMAASSDSPSRRIIRLCPSKLARRPTEARRIGDAACPGPVNHPCRIDKPGLKGYN